MSVVAERFTFTQWLPPWVRHQHVTRYSWAGQFVANLRIADAACGAGYGSEMLLREGRAAQVEGFDLSTDAVENARQQYAANEQLRFEVADVTRLPVADGAYDVCVSFETIEHVPNDVGVIAEAARILKPEGKFICSTPNRDLFDPGTTLVDKPINPFHVRQYDFVEFEGLLRTQFRTIEWYGQTFHDSAYRRFLCGVGRKLPTAAIRMHQAKKVLTVPFDSPKRHTPHALRDRFDPEIFIAVCTK